MVAQHSVASQHKHSHGFTTLQSSLRFERPQLPHALNVRDCSCSAPPVSGITLTTPLIDTGYRRNEMEPPNSARLIPLPSIGAARQQQSQEGNQFANEPRLKHSDQRNVDEKPERNLNQYVHV